MRWSGLLAAIALGVGSAQAQDPPDAAPKPEQPPTRSSNEMPDDELLEFLGSLDTEDGELIDDLTDADVAKPVAPPRAGPAPEVKAHD